MNAESAFWEGRLSVLCWVARSSATFEVKFLAGREARRVVGLLLVLVDVEVEGGVEVGVPRVDTIAHLAERGELVAESSVNMQSVGVHWYRGGDRTTTT